MENLEGMIGALVAYLKGSNFRGKRYFIQWMTGLDFIECIFQKSEATYRLKLKTLILLYDLVLNDENIFFDEPRRVRSHVARKDKTFLKNILLML